MTARKTRLSRRNPNAFGSVEQRGDRYRASFRRDGEVIRAPKTFASAKEAHAWLAKQNADQAAGVWFDPRAGADTLTEYANAWLDSRHDIAPRTRATYRHSLDRWVLPTLGKERLDAITPAKVRQWHTDALRRAAAASKSQTQGRAAHPARAWAKVNGMPIASTGRTPQRVVEAWHAAGAPASAKRGRRGDGSAAIASAYQILRTVMNAAEREGLIGRSPVRVPGAGIVRTTERTPATPEQVRAIAAGMPPRLSAAVTLAAWSGLRSGELRALARRHVDLNAGTVRVERSVIELAGEARRFGPTKTDGSNATVALPGFVVATLRDHLAAHVGSSADDLLFPTEAGKILDNARLGVAFRRAKERAGLSDMDLRWHDLRHTSASLVFLAGGGVPDAQRHLRHRTIRAASIYAHAYQGVDRAIADRLDAMFGDTKSAEGTSSTAKDAAE